MTLKKFAASLALLSAFANAAYAESQRPNVLLIVADDLGFTDLGSFGGEIQTPNLDALANAGTRLSNFYTAPTCSPTRSMLLTGIDSHKVGLGSMAEALAPNQQGKPGYEGYLNDKAAFLPKVFADAGYETMMAGKWHLGMTEETSPHARGFQHTFALLEGGAGHLDDLGLMYPKATYRENGKIASLPENFYSTEFYTNKMIQYIDGAKQSDKPFFAYLAYTAPHWPLQAPADSIAEYKGKYAAGYDELYKQRVANAKARGVAPANTRIVPRRDQQPAWDSLSPEQQAYEARKMEIYAAMVDDLDDYLGKLFDHLKAIGEFDNTIIFFMSDNGAEGGDPNTDMQYFKKHMEACCDNRYENLGKADSYIFYGPNWARASVGLFSDVKGYSTEGGIKAPAIMFYPGQKTQGDVNTRFITARDVLPTLMEITGVSVPDSHYLPIEGQSFLAAEQPVIDAGWELHGNRAIRMGDWKIVLQGRGNPHAQWRLFNLKDDPSERNDLAQKMPGKLAELVQRWDQYAAENGVVLPAYH